MPQIRSGGLFAICLAEGWDEGGPREQGHWEQPGIEAILSHCRNQTLNIVVYYKNSNLMSFIVLSCL